MSLATRCSQCGTVFRVVQDQLKVSEGWVRCGRCSEVFNAVEGLFDLDREAPPEWTPKQAKRRPGGSAPPEAPSATYSYHAPPPGKAAAPGDLVGEEPAEPHEPGPGGRAGDASPPSRIEPVLAAPQAPITSPSDFDPLQPQRLDPESPRAESVRKPEFLRAAEAEARWRRSPRRAALAVAALMLSVLLAGQWAHHFRDVVSARWPVAAPALAAWCREIGCRLEPPRRIEAIAVDSSALARAGAPDQFRLAITLRNRDSIAVALPSVDLALTDASGQLAARRALAPADFGVAAPLLAPGAEQSLQVLLQAPNLRVAGYTVEIFYP